MFYLQLNFKVLAILVFTMGCGALSMAKSDFNTSAIFGEDNRQELYLTDAKWQEIGHSIAGKVSFDKATDHGSFFQLDGILLGHKECPGRFANEITVPSCTGFLVKPNMLVTAAHCIKEQVDCDNFYWVFEYALSDAGDSSYTKVNSNRVYKCKNIVSRVYKNFGDVDYAILELDRDVEGRKPLKLGFDLPLIAGQSLANIGHSNGLPLKFKDSANIINVKAGGQAFESEMDTFQGDSGTPVFDVNSGLVIGITSSGNADHFHDGSNTCRRLKICQSGDKCYLATSSAILNLKDEPIFK